jgi:hypothetical protein
MMSSRSTISARSAHVTFGRQLDLALQHPELMAQ